MAKRRGSNYAYIRDYAALGSDLDDIQRVIAAGYGGVLLNWQDKNFAQAANDLKKAGIRYGIWGDPGDWKLEDYARRMSELYNTYNPDVLVPDLEFRFKGYQGDAGWTENERLANLWKQYGLDKANTMVTVMPNQRDFNYEAWLGLGAGFAPQAYGANPESEYYDPDAIVQTLLDRGVPLDQIAPILGPGHKTGYDGAGLWTVDDFLVGGNREIPRWLGVPAKATAASKTTQMPRAPILPRGTSQSAAQIQSSGLRWGGKTFTDKAAFAKHLASTGANYDTWAARHRKAAEALGG